jgi:hypothetical protein
MNLAATTPMQEERETMKHIMIAIVCGALLALGTSCSHKTTGNSILTASAGGRELKATVDGPAWVGPAEDKFTVKLKGHEIVIEKERLLVDKAERAKVPADAKKFEFFCTNKVVRLVVDGTEAFAFGIAK